MASHPVEAPRTPSHETYRVVGLGNLTDEWSRHLGGRPFCLQRLNGPVHDLETLFQQVLQSKPELIVLADQLIAIALMPVLCRLRYHPQTNDRPIVVLCDGHPEKRVIEGMESGVLRTMPPSSPQVACLNLSVQIRDGRAARCRTLRELAGAMAHSLNQPLAAILGSAEIISKIRCTLPEEVAQALDLIRRNATEMDTIVKKLDDLPRYETMAYPGHAEAIIDLEKSAQPYPDQR